MAIPKGEFQKYVEAIQTILRLKSVDWEFTTPEDIFLYDPTENYSIPSIGIRFMQAYPSRTDRKYYRYQMVAEVILFWSEFDQEYSLEYMNNLLADMVLWILKNQTLGNYTMMVDVQSVATIVIETEATPVVAGRFEVIGVKDLVDAEDVQAGA